MGMDWVGRGRLKKLIASHYCLFCFTLSFFSLSPSLCHIGETHTYAHTYKLWQVNGGNVNACDAFIRHDTSCKSE